MKLENIQEFQMQLNCLFSNIMIIFGAAVSDVDLVINKLNKNRELCGLEPVK